jgi:hypothetical protein
VDLYIHSHAPSWYSAYYLSTGTTLPITHLMFLYAQLLLNELLLEDQMVASLYTASLNNEAGSLGALSLIKAVSVM